MVTAGPNSYRAFESELEAVASEARGHARRGEVDLLYDKIHTAIHKSAKAVFERKATKWIKPRDTEAAVRWRVVARARLRELPGNPEAEAGLCGYLDAKSLVSFAITSTRSREESSWAFALAERTLDAKRADRAVRTPVRRDRNRLNGQRLGELEQAWLSQDFATAWRLSRALSGKKLSGV